MAEDIEYFPFPELIVRQSDEPKVPKVRTVSQIIASLPKKKINLGIHKEVLRELENLSKNYDIEGIKHIGEEIRKNPVAKEHARMYSSFYKNALGELYEYLNV